MERNLETEFDLPDRLHHPDPIRAAAALELVRLRDATLAGLEASYAAMHQDPRRATREQRAKGQYHGPGNGGVGPTRAVNDFVDRCNAIGAPEGMIADNVVFLLNAVQSLLARAEERHASEEERRAEEFDRHLAASTAPNATNSQEQQQGVRGDEVSDPPPDTVRSAVSAVAWSSSAGHPPEDSAEADAARPAAATRRSSAGSAIGAAPSASSSAVVVPAGPGNERSVSTASTALPSTALVLSSDALEAIQGPRDGSVVSPPRSPLQLPGSPTPEPRLPLRESHSRDDTRCDTGTGTSPPEVEPVVPPPSEAMAPSAVVCDRAVGPDDAPSSGAPVGPPPPHPSLEPGFLAAAVQAIYETQRYRQHEARSHSEPEYPHHHHADPRAVEVTATTTRAVPLLSPPRDRDARPAVRPPREEIDMSAATAATDPAQRSGAVSPRCQTCATKRGTAGGQVRQREHSAPRDRPASRTATPVSQPRSNHPSPHTSRYDVKTRLDTTIASDAPPPPKQRASPLDGLPPSSKAPRREVQETRASMLRRLARRAKIEAQSVGPAVDPWAKPSATQKTSRSSSVTAPPRRGPPASVRSQPKVPQQRSARRLRPPSPPEDAVFEEPQLLPTASRVDITQNHRLFHPRDVSRRQRTAEVAAAAPRAEPINPTGPVDLVDLSSLAGLSPPTPSRTGSTQRADSASPDALRPGMAWPREQAEREQSARAASASVRQRSMEQVMRDKDAMRRALQEAVQSPQPLLSPADDGSPVAASSWGPQHQQPSHSTPTVRGEHTMDRPAAGPLGSAYVSDRSLSSGRASPGAVFAFGQAHIVPGPVRERALGVHTASPQPSPQPLPHPSAHGPGDHNDVTDTVGVSPSTASAGSDAGEDVFPEDPPPAAAAVASVRGSSQAQQAQPYNASPSHSTQAPQQWLGSLHTVPLTPTPATPASSVGAVVTSGRFTRPSHSSDRPAQHGSTDDPVRQALQDQQSSELLLGSPARSLGDGGSRAPSPQRPASAHGSTPRSWRPLPSHAPGGLSPASRAFLERASKSIGAAQKVRSDA